MTHTEYMELKQKIVDAMYLKNVYPEQRADEIMKLVGIEHEDPAEAVKE
jgi:predicted metal-binding transcription factor (methanogenesis marker protein 9)